MNRYRIPLLAVLLGAVCFLLRLFQNMTGFEADTGLPVRGNVPALALTVLLPLAALALALLARRADAEGEGVSFSAFFGSDERRALAVVVAGAFLMALSGVWELSSRGAATVLSADGMTVVRASSASLTLLTGVLSLVSAACLLSVLPLCKKDAAQGSRATVLLAVPLCLVVRLIVLYRAFSVDPILAGYCVELLCVVFLTLGFYRLSSFAVRAGRARLFTFYVAFSVVLALTLLADGLSAAGIFGLGGALALLGFLLLHLTRREETEPAE
ncbi:MAG: hypothetical protein IKN53_05200 [Oscillibacter sp.]|nr:hypothetical protein [Oscillibacter sp.]